MHARHAPLDSPTPVKRIGELETSDATHSRIKWYTGLALFAELGAAKLTGILP